MSISGAQRKLLHQLLDSGYVEVPGGKHRKFKFPATGYTLTFPHSPKDDVIYGPMKKTMMKAIEHAQDYRQRQGV